MNDLSFAIRQLVKNPGFTLVAVLTLALGIMATTTMYSVIYAVVLDPFPYKDVNNLMSVKVWDPSQRGYRTGYTTDQFLEIAGRNSIFEGVIASTISDVVWTGDGDPQRLRGNHGTPNTFEVMGVPPLLGRGYRPVDGTPGAEPVVVLGYRFWQRQFGGDASVVGRKLRLNDKVRTVVGVMPKRFMWRGADVYLPIVFERGRVVESVYYVHLLGRLKLGVTSAQAEADLRPIIEDLKQREPSQFPEKWNVGLLSFKETFPSSIRENLWILFGAVGLLLLIACANVSNLLLSRASARQREMAVRSALGASRARLIRQLLTESLLLAVCGGVLGVVLASASLRAILALVPPNTIPDESEIALKTPVLWFTLGVSALTSVVFGLAPALHVSARDLAITMRETGRGLAGSIRQKILRQGLVVAEVALSLMLLVGASLMMRTFLAMQNVELGFRSDHLLTLRIPLSEQQYPEPDRRSAFFREVLERVRSLPGVKAVGLNTSVHPLGNLSAPVDVPGSAKADPRPVVIHQINTDYPPFTLLGWANRLVALTQTDPTGLSRAVMSQVYAIDKNQPVTEVRTIETVLRESIFAGPRFNFALFAVFAALGLTLAIIGVYGVMANSVAQQTHDIGVRMAIGASPRQIAGMIVKHGSILLLAGVALGLAGGFLTTRLLSRQIWSVSPFDPISFSAVSGILLATGLLAGLWPARRAARIEPMEALRHE